MFSSLLFFFFAIAVSSEHLQAQPSTTPSPDAWKPYAKRALAHISSSLNSMKYLSGAPGNASLFEAEQSILTALNITDHKEIFSEVYYAYQCDSQALREIKAACPNVPEKERGHCNVVCVATEIAMKQLLEAVWKVPPKTPKKLVR